jgi:hypothetical protein
MIGLFSSFIIFFLYVDYKMKTNLKIAYLKLIHEIAFQ